jgi:hypothetical protein
MSQTPSAKYFAGHFDAEGSISCRLRPNKKTLFLCCAVPGVCLPNISIYKDAFGGCITKVNHTEKDKEQNRTLAHQWSSQGLLETKRFLETIKPYAFEKLDQIETALRYLYYRLQWPVSANNIPMNPDVAQKTYSTLIALNGDKTSGRFEGKTINPCTNQYFAGHYDGEGSVTTDYQRGKNSLRLLIQVSSACLPILEDYTAAFGGSITRNTNHKTKTENHKPMHQACIASIESSYYMLKAMRPYLIEKQQQVDVALDWLTYRLQFPINPGRSKLNLDQEFMKYTQDTLRKLKDVTQVWDL